MSPQAHFSALLKTLHKDKQSLYERLLHTRVETAYSGRTLILYRMYKREPEYIDRLIVRDFECDDEQGASSLVVSTETSMEWTISYTPVQIGEHNVFLFLPLHAKLRWSATEGQLGKGSLAFPLCVRTQSRLTKAGGKPDLREKGVTYCETGTEYAREFENATV